MKKIKKTIVTRFRENIIYPIQVKNKPKIFCIGRNKTGTTSLKKAFEDLDYVVGNQRKAEFLMTDYERGNFRSIIDYCRSAQVFQDFPFSFPETYKYLNKYYPDSKFILTIRDSPEQWYNSVTKFHSKRFGKGKLPTKEDLKNANYVWKGWMWQCNRLMYKTPEHDIYNKEMLIESYNQYNETVKEYFKDRPESFIVINLNEQGSYKKLMGFLNIDSPFEDFPWENKTVDTR